MDSEINLSRKYFYHKNFYPGLTKTSITNLVFRKYLSKIYILTKYANPKNTFSKIQICLSQKYIYPNPNMRSQKCIYQNPNMRSQKYIYQNPNIRFQKKLLPSTKCLTSSLTYILKGVFAKNERGYRLTAKNKRFW